MGQRAELLVDAHARVDGDDRDAGGRGLHHRVFERIGVGQRDDDAVDLGADQVLDKLRLGDGVRAAARAEVDAVGCRGILGALLDHGPERVFSRVGVHGQAQDEPGLGDLGRLGRDGSGLGGRGGRLGRSDTGGQQQAGDDQQHGESSDA